MVSSSLCVSSNVARNPLDIPCDPTAFSFSSSSASVMLEDKMAWGGWKTPSLCSSLGFLETGTDRNLTNNDGLNASSTSTLPSTPIYLLLSFPVMPWQGPATQMTTRNRPSWCDVLAETCYRAIFFTAYKFCFPLLSEHKGWCGVCVCGTHIIYSTYVMPIINNKSYECRQLFHVPEFTCTCGVLIWAAAWLV